MLKINQFWACELILLSVSIIHRYILQDSWNCPIPTKTQYIITVVLNLCVAIATPSGVAWLFVRGRLIISKIWVLIYCNGSQPDCPENLVLWTISYEKLTKLVQLNEKPAVDACARPVQMQQNISHVSELICSQQDSPGTKLSGPKFTNIVFRRILRYVLDIS